MERGRTPETSTGGWAGVATKGPQSSLPRISGDMPLGPQVVTLGLGARSEFQPFCSTGKQLRASPQAL